MRVDGWRKNGGEQTEPERAKPERGTVFREWWIRCGITGREESLGEENHRKALQEARDRGWVHTRSRGWISPEEAERLGIGPRGVRERARDKKDEGSS